MDYEDFVAQVEQDRQWREDELRVLLNDLARRGTEEERDLFRRPLVALHYAHYEGFTKFALQLYVDAVNMRDLTCIEVTPELAALSCDELFRELRNPNPKGKLFKGALPTDTALHKFARERHFLEQIDNVLARKLQISDDAVDTESNLKADVLRKNLYRLGLSVAFVDEIESELHQLVNARNGISHGDNKMKKGVTEKQYAGFSKACKKAMDEVDKQVRGAYRNAHYLKTNTTLPV